MDATVKEHGKLDVIINNAGIMPIRPIQECNTEEWDAMVDINIKGVLYGIAAALPVFVKQNSGQFINMSSIAGVKVFAPGGTVYSGTSLPFARYLTGCVSRSARRSASAPLSQARSIVSSNTTPRGRRRRWSWTCTKRQPCPPRLLRLRLPMRSSNRPTLTLTRLSSARPHRNFSSPMVRGLSREPALSHRVIQEDRCRSGVAI